MRKQERSIRQRFSELTVTTSVLDEQQRHGSHAAYARLAQGDAEDGVADVMTAREWSFIAARDSFYLASVSQTGWPYVQHRGGPVGFVRRIDAHTIGWAEMRGNRQYISAGNVAGNDRVAMILMDYPQRRRLKLLGHIHIAEPDDRPDLMAVLADEAPAEVDHFFTVHVEAFDWNCPHHITQRFTLAEIEALTAPLHEEIARLTASLGGPAAS